MVNLFLLALVLACYAETGNELHCYAVYELRPCGQMKARLRRARNTACGATKARLGDSLRYTHTGAPLMGFRGLQAL